MADIQYRHYHHQQDFEAVKRIWFEIGWLTDDNAHYLADFMQVGQAFVATINGVAECCVHTSPGLINYQAQQLPMGAVTAVVTSRIARRLGLAKQLVAQALAKLTEQGCAIACLSMFEQGFYDRLGFGTGSYEHTISFDPATLTIDRRFPIPQRLTAADWQDMHQAMINRKRSHGACSLTPPLITKAELGWIGKGFGLGYRDPQTDELSHFFYASAKGEHGPYRIHHCAWQTTDQLLELLALMRSLGDQVSTIQLLEPGDIQLQDLLKQPMRNRLNSKGSEQENISTAEACWQLRILDLPACLAKTYLPTAGLRFNLKLTDPAPALLDEDHSWTGCGGDYVITLGPTSSVEPGIKSDLPTLKATIGAFSRLWFGIRPASSLAATDELQGPDELLQSLDREVRLPAAHFGWEF